MYVFSSTLIVEHYIYVKEIWFGKKNTTNILLQPQLKNTLYIYVQ
jgi:hypothetical protein